MGYTYMNVVVVVPFLWMSSDNFKDPPLCQQFHDDQKTVNGD